MLVVVPQRNLASPYQAALLGINFEASARVEILTMSALVRRMAALFWPLIGPLGGFRQPYAPPNFLTLETSQFYMGQIVNPLIDRGSFSTVSIPRNRLFSQLIDNLNKSAIVGFSHREIGSRLKDAWVGDSAQLRVYDDVQTSVSLFREYCLDHNLVDYSLQMELFRDILWQNPMVRSYLRGLYRHLVYDNAEEDPPYAHDIIQDWLPEFDSALIVVDENAGYHSFLGADPLSAERFRQLCDNVISWPAKLDENAVLADIANVLAHPAAGVDQLSMQVLHANLRLPATPQRFFPQLLGSIAEEIGNLVEAGTPPDEIVVLAPFVSDSNVFTLKHELDARGIPSTTLRPSGALNDDSVIQTLLDLCALAHPDWHLPLDPDRLSAAVAASVESLDLVRAKLILAETSSGPLPSFDGLPEESRERIPSKTARHYETLRKWLELVDQHEPLDVFLSRLFGEVLSQPGFGYHNLLESGTKTANLIDSYKKFRLAIGPQSDLSQQDFGRQVVEAVQSGIIAAQYLPDPESLAGQVLIAPVMTFLMQNRRVAYQFWLNIGSPGWYERLEQPLTHPYVLSRNWQPGERWTTDDELALSQQNLARIISGLVRRCQTAVYLGVSDFNEAGVEERGLLLTRTQSLYRRVLRKERHG